MVSYSHNFRPFMVETQAILDKNALTSATEKLLYLTLCCISNVGANIETEELAELCFCSEDEINYAMESMKEKGIISEVEEDGNKLLCIHGFWEKEDRWEPRTFTSMSDFYSDPAKKKEKKPNFPIDKGYVYFIKESYSGRYKIGKAKNLDHRLNTFSVKLPFEIELTHVIHSKSYNKTEDLFHEHFKDKRTNGEWFELNEKDIEDIKLGNFPDIIHQSIDPEKETA